MGRGVYEVGSVWGGECMGWGVYEGECMRRGVYGAGSV